MSLVVIVVTLIVVLSAKALYFAGPGHWLGVWPFQVMLMAFVFFCLRMIVSRIDVTPEGLNAVGIGYVEKIAWEDIEAIEPLSRSEAVLAILRLTKGPVGLTSSGYVRVRHKGGALMFAPENRSEFMQALHDHLMARPAAVQIPLWQCAEAANAEIPKVQRAGRS